MHASIYTRAYHFEVVLVRVTVELGSNDVAVVKEHLNVLMLRVTQNKH